MDHDEINFTLRDGIEQLLDRQIAELLEESEFLELDVSTQLEKARVELFSTLSKWADWEHKNAQVNYYKLTGRMG